jgi:L-amino acid N-acyltransferase YncA
MSDLPASELVRVRDADASRDAAACAAVYAPYVTDSIISFEDRPPTAQEMEGRIAGAYAWLVAEGEDGPFGYAYGSAHRERAAYRWAADVAIYIDARHHRAGVGRTLYTSLFERLRAMGLWTLCAGVTEPNPASIGLHRSLGFAPVGAYRRIGWKHGAWHDVSWWQLELRPGEPGPPAEIGSGPSAPSGDSSER